ncbi:MAG: ATP-binding protein [Bacteroidota bacterium]|jgi:signal transduction histidine kinase
MRTIALRRAWVLIVLWAASCSLIEPAAGQPNASLSKAGHPKAGSPAVRQTSWAEHGLPIIENYVTSDQNVDAMNWSSVRDARGILYVANTDGILEYDGVVWRFLRSVNGSPVFSLALSTDGTLYFGMHRAFGRVVTDTTGRLRMELLSDRLPEYDRDFMNVWSVHTVGNTVWFRSEEGLFRWDGSNVSVIRPRTGFKQSHLVDDLLYVLVENVGLHIVGKYNVTLAPGGEALNQNGERVFFMLPAGDGRLLIGTKLQGMLFYDGRNFTQAWTPAIRAKLPKELSCGVLLADSTWAIGTSRQGIWIIDREGMVRRIFDGASGLQNNIVIGLNADREHVLWASLDNGLSRIAWPSSVTVFGRSSRLEGRVLDLARFKGQIFVATTQGVFRLRTGEIGTSELKKKLSTFEMLPGLPTQCFDLLKCGDDLLIVTALGVYSFDGRSTHLVTESPARVLHSIHGSSDSVLAGLEEGLLLLTRNGDHWNVKPVFRVVKGMSNSITEGPDGTIWIGQIDGSAYALTLKQSLTSSTVRKYTDFQKDNAVNPLGMAVMQGSLWLWTEDTICVYNPRSKRFAPDPQFWRKLGVPEDWSVREPYQDIRGRIWMQLFSKSRRYGYASRADGKASQLNLVPELEQSIVHFTKSEQDGVVWFGTESELFRFDELGSDEPHAAFRVLIRTLSQDTIDWYLGADMSKGSEIEIPYSDAGVSLRFVAPSFIRRDRMQYRWKLSGLNDTWTDWSLTKEMTYPALSEGSYSFHVEARGADGTISDEAVIHFRIHPPWHRSWWAYALYVFLAIGAFITALRYRTRTLEDRSRSLEQTVRERTDEIRSQAEKIRSQAEELETLDSIVRTVNKEVRLTNLLSALLQQTLLLFPNVNVACYFQRNPEDALFRLVATVGEPLDQISAHAFSLSELIDDPSNSIHSIQDGVYVLLGLEKHWNLSDVSLLSSQKAFMGMSDMQHGVLRGFLVLGSEKNHSFSADDLRRLLRLREHVSSAVAKAVAIRELEQKNTLLDQANKQLRETQQQLIVHEKLAALGELTAGIAHEIQNPLNFVNNFSSLSLELLDELEEHLLQNRDSVQDQFVNLIDTVRGNCERIREHGMRATSIVSAMLMHTRKGSVRREAISLNEFLDQFVMLSYHGMRMLHPQYELKLHTEYDRGIERVTISPQEMSRVIVNLCNNAWEAAIANAEEKGEPRNPEVTVRSMDADDRVRISIRDNGIGIPEDIRGKIFEPFFTTKRNGNNAGLGLSMSYEIVTQMHKGLLTVTTESGVYTEFSIEIPKE